jgi:CubicO group peptidase (beta-lactamase class C family)
MMLTRRRFTALLAGAPFATAAFAHAASAGIGAKQRAAVERLLRGFVQNGVVPGISFSIGNASTTFMEGAAGLRALSPAEPMQPATRCALASVSKQFAAAAIFLLQQRGRVSLDAPLSRYLPEFAYAGDMTLAQVLTMRAGVPADDETCEAPINGRIDETTLIANLNRHKLDFTPGKYFSYTNCGYNLAGVVVERVSGKSYANFVRENFFEPLGMRSSYVLGARSDSNFAHGYARVNGRWQAEPATRADKSFASGNLVSTAGDMQRWNRSLFNATILSRASIKKMFEVPTRGGSAHTNYASGWFVEPSGAIWHGGTLAGYGTMNLLVPATGYAIVLLSNCGPGDKWKPADVAREVYNTAELGPPLPPLLPRTRSTAPQPTKSGS